MADDPPPTTAADTIFIRVKRPRDEPSRPALAIVQDEAPRSRRRISLAQLSLQPAQPVPLRYELLAEDHPTRPELASAEKAPPSSRKRHPPDQQWLDDERGIGPRYRCTQRRTLPLEHVLSGDALRTISRKGDDPVRVVEIELASRAQVPSNRIIPFGPTIPPPQPGERSAPSSQAPGFAYDIYVRADSSAPPPTDEAAEPLVHIHLDDDDLVNEELLSDEDDGDGLTDDSNSEGYFANDYPDTEAESGVESGDDKASDDNDDGEDSD